MVKRKTKAKGRKRVAKHHDPTIEELRDQENEERRHMTGPPPPRRFAYGLA